MSSEPVPRWTSGHQFLLDAHGTLWLKGSGTPYQLTDANQAPIHDRVDRAELEYRVLWNRQYGNWLLLESPRLRQRRGAGDRSGNRGHHPNAGAGTGPSAGPSTARTPSAPQVPPVTYADDINREYRTALVSPRDILRFAGNTCYARHLFTDGERHGDAFPIVQIIDNRVWNLTWDDTLSTGMTYVVDWKPRDRYFLLEDPATANPSGTRAAPSMPDNGANGYASGNTGYYHHQNNTGNSGASGNGYTGYGQYHSGNYGNYGGTSYSRRGTRPMAAKGSLLIGRKAGPSRLSGAASHTARRADLPPFRLAKELSNVDVRDSAGAGPGKRPAGNPGITNGPPRHPANGIANPADITARSVAQKALARPEAVSTKAVSATIPPPTGKPAAATDRAATPRTATPVPTITALIRSQGASKKALPWSVGTVVGALKAGQVKAGARPEQSAALASVRAQSRAHFAPGRSTTTVY